MSQREERPSLPALGAELWDQVLRYAKQETVDPVKALGRYVVFGVAGSLLLSAGFVLLEMALLRALQTQMRTFHGNLSWIPYVVVVVAAALVLGATVALIAKGKPR
jgi:hypothetical protein